MDKSEARKLAQDAINKGSQLSDAEVAALPTEERWKWCKILSPEQVGRAVKPPRGNEVCPCGSGLKFKRCCRGK